MKSLNSIVKYFIVPVSSVVGLLYAFDTYIIQRAETVVLPTEVKVESIKSDVEEIKLRTRNIENILMNRR